MNRPVNIVWLVSFAVLACCSVCVADTFTNRCTGQVLHGYVTSVVEDGNAVVQTMEKGKVGLDLTGWRFTEDRLGRKNKVVVLSIDKNLMLEMETSALVKAIKAASDEGPYFILLELDTPGGRVDLTRQICTVITQDARCPVVAYVKGGEYGGAISAGAAIALACDSIYMGGSTAIGAASLATLSETGMKDFRETFGEEIGEKINSAWRAYLASLAEHHHRPALLAGAMVDKDLEVVEVSEADKRLFIEPVNRTEDQRLIHVWTTEGSLLTLTADQAVECGIADQIVNSREQLLRLLDAQNAEVLIDNSFQEAGRHFERVKRRSTKLSNSLDLKIKRLRQTQDRPRAVRLVREIQQDYKTLVALAKHYPDLRLNTQVLEQQVNTAEVMLEEAKPRR